jgi:hypothetical protein
MYHEGDMKAYSNRKDRSFSAKRSKPQKTTKLAATQRNATQRNANILTLLRIFVQRISHLFLLFFAIFQFLPLFRKNTPPSRAPVCAVQYRIKARMGFIYFHL